MFDILDARGLVEGAVVVDLFAGSGALGIEALSRGASSVTFVERDPRALRAIDANLAGTGFSSGSRVAARALATQTDDPGLPTVKVRRTDVEAWLELYAAAPVDLVLADPPYEWKGWQLLFRRCAACCMLLEHRDPLEAGGSYEISRQYRYGGTLVTLVRDKRHSAAADEPDSSDKDSF